MISNNININSINDWADFWHYQIGVNVIPADTKTKKHMKIGHNGKINLFLMNYMNNEKEWRI